MSETFGLVHGAWHAASCWEMLIEQLDALGGNAIAMDLPISDPGATIYDYADVVVTALKGAPEHVVLVGHSLGAAVAHLVAGRRPVGGLIYLCPVLGPPDKFASRDRPPVIITPTTRTEGMTELDSASGRDLFYHDCSREVAAWAVARLRSQRMLFDEVPPARKWPNLPAWVIGTLDDRAIDPDNLITQARIQLGEVVHFLPGGHSPFLSRPEELAKLMMGLVAT
jgi:pimeloyl-ACP methyl ester carboxylesterase